MTTVSPAVDGGASKGTNGDVDLVKSSEPPARVGANEWGRIDVGSNVVEKIAAQAAVEIPDAGGAAARLLGRQLPGAGHLGIRRSGLNTLPKVHADVDGQLGFLDVELSVRWPAPVGQVTEAVRQHLCRRVCRTGGTAGAGSQYLGC